MNKLSLGSSPVSESCAQLGSSNPNYETQAYKECAAYMGQLKRHFYATHNRQPNCGVCIVSNAHDFGTYFEVAAQFTEDEPSEADAYWLEANCPEEWDELALKEFFS